MSTVDEMSAELQVMIDQMSDNQRHLFIDTAMLNLHEFSKHVCNQSTDQSVVVGNGVMIHALAALVGYANQKNEPDHSVVGDVDAVNAVLVKYQSLVSGFLSGDTETTGAEASPEEPFFWGQYL